MALSVLDGIVINHLYLISTKTSKSTKPPYIRKKSFFWHIIFSIYQRIFQLKLYTFRKINPVKPSLFKKWAIQVMGLKLILYSLLFVLSSLFSLHFSLFFLLTPALILRQVGICSFLPLSPVNRLFSILMHYYLG